MQVLRPRGIDKRDDDDEGTIKSRAARALLKSDASRPRPPCIRQPRVSRHSIATSVHNRRHGPLLLRQNEFWTDARGRSPYGRGAPPSRDYPLRDASRLLRDDGLPACCGLMLSYGVQQLSSTWPFPFLILDEPETVRATDCSTGPIEVRSRVPCDLFAEHRLGVTGSSSNRPTLPASIRCGRHHPSPWLPPLSAARRQNSLRRATGPQSRIATIGRYRAHNPRWRVTN